MRVLVMRHGEAMDAGVDVDSHRYLSPNGRSTTARIGALLRTRGTRIDHIVTSPLVRAAQTAEIIAAVLGHPGPISVHAALAPSGSTAAALSVLERFDDDEAILLVSHEPTVRVIAGSLSGQGHAFPPFRTSSVAVLETDGARGKLLERIEPPG